MDTQRQWDDVVSKHFARLKKDKRLPLIEKNSDYESFRRTLETSSGHFSKSKAVRFTNKLEPGIRHLRVFADALGSLSQVQANPLCLIWGSLYVLATSVSHYYYTLDLMTEMLHELTENIKRFVHYMTLRPDNSRLQEYLVLIYDDFVSFCIDALIFYNRNAWLNFVRSVGGTVKESFENAKRRMSRHVDTFEKEARSDIDGLVVRGMADIGIVKSNLSLESPISPSSSTPPISPKSPVSRVPMSAFEVPYSRNPKFTARDKEILYLHKTLSPEQPHRTCLIHSMGGVGKSQLAAEYAYRYRDTYKYIFWLAAEQQPELARQFASISQWAESSDWLSYHNTAESNEIAVVKQWLQTFAHNWLLIYDNAESWETLKPYWPKGGSGSVIITSQKERLKHLCQGEIPLEPLEPHDGAFLLLRHLRPSDEKPSESDIEEAVSISTLLGGLPMGIAHMAGYIDQSKTSLAEFRELYGQRAQSRIIWSQNCRESTYQYNGLLNHVWDIALAELPEEAKNVVFMLSMFNPDHICEAMLFGKSARLPLNPISTNLITALGDRQLVQRNIIHGQPFWSMHRALQLNILHRLDDLPVIRQRAFERALDILHKAYPRQSAVQAPSNQNWATEERYLPHVIHMQEVYEQSIPTMSPTPVFAQLLGDAGNYLWERAHYHESEKTLHLAEAIYETAAWEDPIEHSKVLTVLGIVKQETGISGRQEGLKRCQRSLKLRENYAKLLQAQNQPMPKSDLLLLGNAWNDVGCNLLEQGNYLQSEALFLRSLKIKADAGIKEGEDAFFNFAENLKNLSLVRIAQGRYYEAVTLTRRAARLVEHDVGPDSASAQAFKFHLAYALYYDGDIDGSLILHEEVRQARLRLLGKDETHTLNSYYACSLLLRHSGRFEEAEYILVAALSAKGRWPPECVVRAKYLLAAVCDHQYLNDPRVPILYAEARHEHHLLDPYAPDRIVSKTGSDWEADLALSDHLVSFEAGRSSIGRIQVADTILDIP